MPRDFWATSETYGKLCRRLNLPDASAVLDHFDIDIRYIEGPRYIGPRLVVHPDGSANDIWGVPRLKQTVGTGEREQSYHSVTRFPLAAVTDCRQLDDYEFWPSPDWFDYTPVHAEAKAVRERGRVVAFMGDRLNRFAQLKPAMYLRGIDQALMDMLTEPEIFQAITDRLTAFYNEYLTRILEAADGMIDVLVTGDDFGQQGGPLCSVELWEQRLRAGFEGYIRIAHAAGVPVMHHTCGSIFRLLPKFVDCRLDILQALQPGVAEMDFRRMKAEFGHRICFQGGIGIQRALPFGAPADVRAEVRDRVEALAPGGGYIISTAHNIQGDTPTENVLALIAAYDEFGRYR
ncbi:MAG: uroporphyrinogen decarboxylase family protein [Opitutaceae bacterium]|nr:uroporphyrinogen decarboxylase family protein [Opitutaceae bacterium]